MSDLEPIVSKKEKNPAPDPSAKKMDPKTAKKHLIVVASVFVGIFALCLSAVIAGICLSPSDSDPVLQNDARALYYDEGHHAIGTPSFGYQSDQEGNGYWITSISAPEVEAPYALVLPQYQQRDFNEPAGYVTGIAGVQEGSNIFGKNPTDFTLSRVVFTSYVSYIGSCSFSGIEGLTTVQGSFSSSSLRIMARAFAGSESLASFPFPASLTYIGEEAFLDCALDKVDLTSSGISQIGDRAFAGNSELVSISLPASLTDWGERLFAETAATAINYAGTPAQFNQLKNSMIEAALAGSQITSIVFSDGSSLSL